MIWVKCFLSKVLLIPPERKRNWQHSKVNQVWRLPCLPKPCYTYAFSIGLPSNQWRWGPLVTLQLIWQHALGHCPLGWPQWTMSQSSAPLLMSSGVAAIFLHNVLSFIHVTKCTTPPCSKTPTHLTQHFTNEIMFSGFLSLIMFIRAERCGLIKLRLS